MFEKLLRKLNKLTVDQRTLFRSFVFSFAPEMIKYLFSKVYSCKHPNANGISHGEPKTLPPHKAFLLWQFVCLFLWSIAQLFQIVFVFIILYFSAIVIIRLAVFSIYVDAYTTEREKKRTVKQKI